MKPIPERGPGREANDPVAPTHAWRRASGIGIETRRHPAHSVLFAPWDPSGRPDGEGIASSDPARLIDLLGLSEEELCAALDADPLTLLSGQLDHRPELPILLDLLAEAQERAGPAVLRRWVRAAGPGGRPIDHLLDRDFGAFEDDLATLAARGFVLRGGGA